MKVKHLLVIIVVLAAIGVVTLSAYFSKVVNDRLYTKGGPHFLYAITGGNGNSLKAPAYVVVNHQNGDVFVADTGNRCIKVFDKNGKFVYEFGGPGTKKPLVYPYGIGLIDNNRLVIADAGAGALHEYNLQGGYIRTWLDAKAKVEPVGIFVTPDKTVYVTDLLSNQIFVFSDRGKLLRKIKSQQVEMRSPQGLAVNNDGTIWVADGGNYNVKLLRPNGELITMFDGGPKRALTMAKGLAVDKLGRIYVADTLSNVIRIFDKKGNDLFSFGPVNERGSKFQLPVGLSVDSGGRIYVADQGNNLVQVWGWR